METYPNFRKLWGRYDKDIEAGKIKFNVTNCMVFIF